LKDHEKNETLCQARFFAASRFGASAHGICFAYRQLLVGGGGHNDFVLRLFWGFLFESPECGRFADSVSVAADKLFVLFCLEG